MGTDRIDAGEERSGSQGQGQGVRRSTFEDDHHSVAAAKVSLVRCFL